MEKIGIVLLKSLKNSRLDKRLMEAKIFLSYESMVGEKISDISKPTFIQNNTLFIGVENHVWLHQLHFLKPDLLDKINSNFPRTVVKDIRFQVCDIKKNKKAESNNKIKRENCQKIDIPEKTMQVIYNISHDIDDEDLRKIFERLMIKDAQYKIKKGENHCLST